MSPALEQSKDGHEIVYSCVRVTVSALLIKAFRSRHLWPTITWICCRILISLREKSWTDVSEWDHCAILETAILKWLTEVFYLYIPIWISGCGTILPPKESIEEMYLPFYKSFWQCFIPQDSSLKLLFYSTHTTFSTISFFPYQCFQNRNLMSISIILWGKGCAVWTIYVMHTVHVPGILGGRQINVKMVKRGRKCLTRSELSNRLKQNDEETWSIS